MKQFGKRLLIALLLVALLAGSVVHAASYPLVFLKAGYHNQTCAEGTTLDLVFSIFHEYKNEILHIAVYDEYGSKVAYLDKQFYNYSNPTTEFTAALDTTGYYGTYTVEYYMSFYTFFAWHDAPSVYQTEFYVVSPCPDNAHTWDNGEITQEPTCVEDGVKTFTCEDCGATRTESIAKISHNYENESVNVEPTCTMPGEMHYSCTTCDDFITEEIPALGHTLGDATVTKEPTCTEAGSETALCSICNEEVTEEIPALGHTFGEATVTKEPTCTEAGSETAFCSICNEEVSEEIPALGHTFGEATVTKEPTCTEAGSKTTVCTACGEEISEQIEPLEHDWDDGEVTVEATAYKDGELTYTCENCGETKTESIPAKGECNGGKNCPSRKFKDVDKNAWYHEAIDYAVEHTLFGGMSDNTFEPNTAMTRAMLVTVLWRYAGSPDEGKNEFNDVKNGQWYTDAVAWAAENEIVSGVGNGKFAPNANISREQMAAILYRYAEQLELDTDESAKLTDFPDGKSVSSYAKDAVSWAVAEGLINGSDGKLMPQGNATRAQVAAILMRFIQNVVNE
ncbi:MAG: S-layer homology domain-containing protein [Ruminococcaceae bacterium]|nr:S-layer homology domain-containing protein [Oscillospiraceae bacterium]